VTVGAAWQGFLRAGVTVCAGTALRVAGNGLAKRATVDPPDGREAS
jgi:hypothetical protein